MAVEATGGSRVKNASILASDTSLNRSQRHHPFFRDFRRKISWRAGAVLEVANLEPSFDPKGQTAIQNKDVFVPEGFEQPPCSGRGVDPINIVDDNRTLLIYAQSSHELLEAFFAGQSMRQFTMGIDHHLVDVKRLGSGNAAGECILKPYSNGCDAGVENVELALAQSMG